MQASTKLCLAFFEFFTVLENKRFFSTKPSPPRHFYQILTPSLLNIYKRPSTEVMY